MRGITTALWAATSVVRDRIVLGRKMRTESISGILRAIDARAPYGEAGVSAPDGVLLFGLRAGESIVSRSHVAPNTCLFRALGRYSLFRRHGHRAVFVMGIRSEIDGGEGHAWVELEGVPFRESIAPELVVTLRHPS